MSVVLQDERQAATDRDGARPRASDGELVRRFVTTRSDGAFEQLVFRHGPVVMAACRRVLGSEQDAAGQGVLGYVSHNALSLANGSFTVMTFTTTKIVAYSLMALGLFTWGGIRLPVPAVAGGSQVILQAGSDAPAAPDLMVAFLADREREDSHREAETEREGRESAEARFERRRSPERDPQLRESEEAERRRDERGEREREAFRPQTEREEILYRMILNLQRQVAQLRRELQPRDAHREGRGDREYEEEARTDRRDPQHAQRRDHAKLERIYHAYDKDKDRQVSLDEFLSMREGVDNPEVRAQAEQQFKRVDRNGDGYVSFDEFLAARDHRTEGDRPRDGDREGEKPRDGDPPRDHAERPREVERERDGDPRHEEGRRDGDRPRDDDAGPER